MGAKYINIELEVRAHTDLHPLLQALGDRFSMNYCGALESGLHLLAGALAGSELSDEVSPDATANGLCELIEKLPIASRKLWDSAEDRVFDVGFDANAEPGYGVNLFSPTTLARMAKINARLAVSIYTYDLAETKKHGTCS